MKSEEKHIDFLETQLELIKQLGVQLYSQKHIGELHPPDRGRAIDRRKTLTRPRRRRVIPSPPP